MITVECFCGMALSYVLDGDLGAPWIEVILIWYHYIVICTLVTIFNGWLSSKDMKLQVLIKEVLIVFHLLTFRILLLCSLASGHRALFLVQETTQELLYIYIYLHIYVYMYIYIYIYIYIVEHKVSSITSEPTQSSSRRVSSLKDSLVLLTTEWWTSQKWNLSNH